MPHEHNFRRRRHGAGINMDAQDFRKHGHAIVDWIADYMDMVRDYPVRSQVKPRDIYDQIPPAPPQAGEDFAALMQDFETIIMPGITHWQHPRFMAYFPANVSPPSILAEMLTSGLGVNGMLWETSPAATELEMRMIDWVLEALDLPRDWSGCIQPGASEATFCAVLMAREAASDFQVAAKGVGACGSAMTVYTSADAHSSIVKAVRMAGLGHDNARLVPTDATGAMDMDALLQMIADDRGAGKRPIMIAATAGTTSRGAVDPVAAIADLCDREGLFLHVDSAWAGTAMIAPDYRPLFAGVERADSFVFNPHKWMGAQFDCSVHCVRDASQLTRTLSVMPEYLRTIDDDWVVNYRDWGIALGRRMRALKLWFVMRSYGLQAIASRITRHCRWAEEIYAGLDGDAFVERIGPVHFSMFCWRFVPEGAPDVNGFNQRVVDRVNAAGFSYITKTKIGDVTAIRFQVGAWNAEAADVTAAWAHIRQIAVDLQKDL